MKRLRHDSIYDEKVRLQQRDWEDLLRVRRKFYIEVIVECGGLPERTDESDPSLTETQRSSIGTSMQLRL